MSPPPPPGSQSGESSQTELSASPASTVRNVSGTMPPITSALQEGDKTNRAELGKGRPGREDHLAPPSPSISFSRSRPQSPGPLEYSTDDEDRPPRSRFMTSFGDSTPRLGGSHRGPPMTAHGSTFGSPAISQGGSAPRPPRLPRNNSTSGHPITYPVAPNSASHPYGSTSRSASRARPGLTHQTSTGQVMTLGKRSKEDDEELEDKGEKLIRDRQKERARARREKEKENQRQGEPPSATGDESFAAQQQRSLGPATGRSVSRTRMPSTSRKQTSEGLTSYAGSIAGDLAAADTISPRGALRPPSVYSSVADEEDEREREQDIIDEVVADVVDEDAQDEEDGADVDEDAEDEGVTLRDRQDAINIEHPFGLPIWKPALYRKSRTITRNAESALHSIPSAAAERHLLPGNLLWVALFGWWLAAVCFVVAVIVSGAEVLGGGRGGYGKTLRGLAWYIGWPFGKYVEGEGGPEESDGDGDEEEGVSGFYTDGNRRRLASDGASSVTVRRQTHDWEDGLPDAPRVQRQPSVSFATSESYDENTPLVKRGLGFRRPRNRRAKLLGRIVYWPLFFIVLAPIMLAVCAICWGFVITIPMAKLNWALLKLLWSRPLEINFRPAPKVVPLTVQTRSHSESGDESGSTTLNDASPSLLWRRTHLKAGQIAPTAGPTSTVLLCVYRAVGLEYYKYTVGGVNIIFINLLPLVFFVIFDAFVLLPQVERAEHRGEHVPPFLALIASQWLIFVLALSSVIPLSYFIGMAVASISAQSSIGMGAVINATFGSIIEIILYGIALTQGKGRLVEGGIVGSILAGVLLMPGLSMVSGALKRKEQKFNAKSAGVTSTMLIMAIIGTLTPTMFYQIYGSVELRCEGCPPLNNGVDDFAGDAWKCKQCFYEHPDPMEDPFYQDQVKTLMYCCAFILLLSYLIGLWFSLRTHASQIWQNPQQLMKSEEGGAGVMHPSIGAGVMHPSIKATMQRVTPQAVMHSVLPQHRRSLTQPPSPSNAFGGGGFGSLRSPKATLAKLPEQSDEGDQTQAASSSDNNISGRVTSANYNLPPGFTPYLESVPPLGMGIGSGSKDGPTPMRLPGSLTTEDFTRAVAVATVSALRHQRSIIGGTPRSKMAASASMGTQIHSGAGGAGGALGGKREEDEEESHGGHEGPSWNRSVSAGVLLGCTLLYAVIAEVLVDVVDVVLQGSKIDEKFLGLTLFTLVPNTTEFMNAVSFAMQGNIALSMEIGSAYALQVCLLQIPAMVAFSALYDPGKMGEVVDTFTLIFPRWDVIAIILAIFLLTYTYIEARSNYHRGSVLVLAYLVLIMGFYFAPVRATTDGNDFVGGGADGAARHGGSTGQVGWWMWLGA